MEHYVGLDVSLKQTSICVVSQTGSVMREGIVDSDPEVIAAFVRSTAPGAVRIGLETGPTATWLWTELKRLGLPVICIDARHAGVQSPRAGDLSGAEPSDRARPSGIVADYSRKDHSAVACFMDDFEACIAHPRFPVTHRRAIRTTNLLERLCLSKNAVVSRSSRTHSASGPFTASNHGPPKLATSSYHARLWYRHTGIRGI
jgi:hypothetical protein